MWQLDWLIVVSLYPISVQKWPFYDSALWHLAVAQFRKHISVVLPTASQVKHAFIIILTAPQVERNPRN